MEKVRVKRGEIYMADLDPVVGSEQVLETGENDQIQTS